MKSFENRHDILQKQAIREVVPKKTDMPEAKATLMKNYDIAI